MLDPLDLVNFVIAYNARRKPLVLIINALKYTYDGDLFVEGRRMIVYVEPVTEGALRRRDIKTFYSF